MNTVLRGLLVISAMLTFGALPSHAAKVTVDFDDIAPTSAPIWANLILSGFRFSPAANYEIVVSEYPDGSNSGYEGSQYIWFNGSDFRNPDYLGPGYGIPDPGILGAMVIDRFGEPFSLRSLFGVLANCSMGVGSSKGGGRLLDTCEDSGGGDEWLSRVHTFSGPEWTRIKWVALGGEFDIATGFDHITFSVREEATLALLGLGLAGLGLSRRRKAA